jgi:hypothetical protein
MTPDDWDQDGKGNITLCPFVGVSTGTMPGNICIIRLEYVRALDQPIDKPDALQLAMTRAQASELARALLRMAEMPHVADREKPRH